MQDVFIYGAGGHCKVTINLLSYLGGYRILGILDDSPTAAGSSCLEYEILGEIASLNKDNYPNCGVVIGVAKPAYRSIIWQKAAALGYESITLVHPYAYVANHVAIGSGSMILANAIVNTGAKIGKGTLINNGAIIEHDCVVGDFVHVASGACMAGRVEIRNGAFIGIGSTIIEFVKIGENATVGAGAVVIEDVPSGATVVGNPAKVIKR
jgi:sugar O-acyltransferase (sialic acid O-acetyltransferase NeuD family)